MATWEAARLERYISRLVPGAEKTARRTADDGVAIVKRHIEQVGAVRTGRLRDSTEAIPIPGGGAQLVVGAPYAAFVNYGTYKMAARPFWEPALSEVAAHMLDIAKDEFSA